MSVKVWNDEKQKPQKYLRLMEDGTGNPAIYLVDEDGVAKEKNKLMVVSGGMAVFPVGRNRKFLESAGLQVTDSGEWSNG